MDFGGIFSGMGEGISGMFSGLFGGKGGGGNDSEGIGGAKAGLFGKASDAKDLIHEGRGGGGAVVDSYLDDE